MQTCSNCGAAARPGAKFCTSCGARLPIVPTGENRGWGNSNNSTEESQQTSTWNQAPANGQQQDATATASSEREQSAASTTAWDQTGATTDATEPATASEQAGETSSPSWSWGQPQTDEAPAPHQDESAAATDEQQQNEDEDSEPSGAESSWISSWSSQRSGGEPTPADQGANATGETVTSASDAAGTDATAEANDEASTTEQDGAGTADPDARPEWMRNLVASQEATDGATSTGDADTSATEPSADQGATSEDVSSATAGAEDQASTPETDREQGSAGTVTERESEAIIASSLSDDFVSDETSAVQDLTEDQTERAAETAEEADAATGGSAATAETNAASADGETRLASEPETEATPDVAAATPVSTPAATADGALGEAESLLDRLRDLLPALAVSGSTQAPTGISGIADQLQQAANENAKPEFDDLRSVLEAAKERPRDVDTMLNLVTKIDPMIDLLHAHGNLLDAISTAVQQLRNDQRQQ